jgi:uncharacterized Zn finger protein
MAKVRPSCPTCKHNQFEPEAYEAPLSLTKLTLVQCIKCGTVVGVEFNPVRDFQWEVLVGRVEKIETLLKEMQPPF